MQGWFAVICFGQVATKTQVTEEQYLHMTFEDDAEFVRGVFADL